MKTPLTPLHRLSGALNRAWQGLHRFSRRHRSEGSARRPQVIEEPIDEAFFAGARFESPRPLVITACSAEDIRGVHAMAQLAVLLFDEQPSPAFSWIGPVGAGSLKRLKAAKVEVVDIDDDLDRAIKFSSAWVYFAPGNTRGYRRALAEALAAGLPCVAMDTPMHRDMLRHAHTGFLCKSFIEGVEHVALLLHSPELRELIGAAARNEARLRWSPETGPDLGADVVPHGHTETPADHTLPVTLNAPALPDGRGIFLSEVSR